MMETISKQPAAKNTTIISTFIKPLLAPLGANNSLRKPPGPTSCTFQTILGSPRNAFHVPCCGAGKRDQPHRHDPAHDHRIGDRKAEGASDLDRSLRQAVVPRFSDGRRQTACYAISTATLFVRRRGGARRWCFVPRRCHVGASAHERNSQKQCERDIPCEPNPAIICAFSAGTIPVEIGGSGVGRRERLAAERCRYGHRSALCGALCANDGSPSVAAGVDGFAISESRPTQ